MKAITYIPFKDELVLKFRPLKGKPTLSFERYKLWFNKEGSIDGINIIQFTEELKEFKKNVNTIQLESIWKNVDITDKDIKETREELLKILERKW